MASWKKVLHESSPSADFPSGVALANLGGGSGSTFLRKDGTWATPTDSNTTYSAGTGMSLSGTTFNCDITDTDTTYSAGTGLTLSSTTFSLSSGAALSNLGGGSGSTFLKKDGTWATPTDSNTTYSAGTGVTLSSTTFSIGQAVATTSNVTFNNTTVDGVLVVDGGSNTAPGIQFDGADDGFFHDTADPGQGIKVMVNNANEFLFANGGDFHADADVIAYSSTISDKRVKGNIKTIDLALEKVKRLRGVEYLWKKGSREGQKDLGLIAQEVQDILPEVVREKSMPLMDKTGKRYLTLDYEKIIAVLIESIKEQQVQIDRLTELVDVVNK